MNEFCKAAVLGILVLCRTQYVSAGPVPMPLEAQLDLASDVVVGRITRITPVDENRGPGSHCGRVTVAIRETLKGRPAKTLQFLGMTALDPDWGGAQPHHACQVGQDGVWVIENGWAPQAGPLPTNKKPEVAKDLNDLRERKWSQPVNGLRAWAAVTESVIIFAVKNDSNVDIFVPYEVETGVVTATVTDDIGAATGLVLRPNESRSRAVSYKKLPAGQLIYLHPDYSSIDLARRQHLAPGRYSVVISCRNAPIKGSAAARISDSSDSVTAWTGEVSAPAVKLTIALSQEEIGEVLAHLEAIDRGTLHRALTSDQYYLRFMAAKRLNEVGDFTSIPLLIAALRDQSQHVGAQYPDAEMASTRYWVNDSLKKLTKHDFGFRWDAPKADREAAIERWKQWYETAGKLQEALTTAWKQIQALKHPLLAGASNVKPTVTEDEHGLVHAEIEFVRNAVWEPKGPLPTSPNPVPLDAKQPYVFIQVSLSRASALSQPHFRSRGLRVYDADYSLLVTVAAYRSESKPF
jgi:hypothetical protein